MEFNNAKFEFIMPDNMLYSAHWYINKTAPDLKRKFEVSIFSGGGYKVSFYTDHRICEKNSKEFINKFLKSLSTTK